MFSPLLDLIRGEDTHDRQCKELVEKYSSNNRNNDDDVNNKNNHNNNKQERQTSWFLNSNSAAGGNDDSGWGLDYCSSSDDDESSDEFCMLMPGGDDNDADDGGVPPPPPLRQGVVSHGAVDMMVKQRNRQAALAKWNNSAGNIGFPSSKEWHAGTTSSSSNEGNEATRGGRATRSLSPCCRRGTNEIATFNWEIYSRGMRAAKRTTVAFITEDDSDDDDNDGGKQQQQHGPLIKMRKQAQSKMRKEMEREKKEKARADRRKQRIGKRQQKEGQADDSEESEDDSSSDSKKKKKQNKIMRSTTGPCRLGGESRGTSQEGNNNNKFHRSATDVPTMRQKKEKEESKRTTKGSRDGKGKIHRSTTDNPKLGKMKEETERARGRRKKKVQRCTTDPGGRSHHRIQEDHKKASSKSPTRGGKPCHKERELYSNAFSKLVDASQNVADDRKQ